MDWTTSASFIDKIQVLRYSGDELVLFLNNRRYVYQNIPATAIANQIDQLKKWKNKKEAGRKIHLIIKNLEPNRVKDEIYKAKNKEAKSFNLTKFASNNSYQEGVREFMGDIQRYLYDPYSVSIYITQLESKTVHISLTISHLSVGTQVWQDFWKYDISEESKARKTYNELKKISGEIYEEFLTNKIPNNLFFNYIRNATMDVDKEHRPKSRIPQINWAREVNYEKDWRSNLYGNRYPTNEIDGY